MIEWFRRGLYLVLFLLWIALLGTRIQLVQSLSIDTIPTEVHAVDRLAMSLRRAIANILWVRIDEYVHAGEVVSIESTDGDKKASSIKGVSAVNSAPELYPLARLITVLDPSFVRVGPTLGIVLDHCPEKSAEMTRIIRNLIRANPEHPRLYLLYAVLGTSQWKKKDAAGAVPYLKRAIELFPRITDERALARADEPPPDKIDDFTRRECLTALVLGLVELQDYESAIRYWMLCGGFAPSNKVFQVLLRYQQQKLSGAIDRAGLSRYYDELVRQERDFAHGRQPNTSVPDDHDEHHTHHNTIPPPPSRDHDVRVTTKAQPITIINLGLPSRQALKMCTILAITALLLIVGRRTGRLGR